MRLAPPRHVDGRAPTNQFLFTLEVRYTVGPVVNFAICSLSLRNRCFAVIVDEASLAHVQPVADLAKRAKVVVVTDAVRVQRAFAWQLVAFTELNAVADVLQRLCIQRPPRDRLPAIQNGAHHRRRILHHKSGEGFQ